MIELSVLINCSLAVVPTVYRNGLDVISLFKYCSGEKTSHHGDPLTVGDCVTRLPYYIKNPILFICWFRNNQMKSALINLITFQDFS